MEFNFNTTNVDLSQTPTQSFPTIQKGWNKICLAEVGDKTEEKSHKAFGALFTFKVVDSGLTFKKWYCIQAIHTDAKWRQAQFENTLIRIAQCVGVDHLNNANQLFNKPFYAFLAVSEREYESKETDREGNFLKKTITDVEFAKGMLTDNLLSCKEYDQRVVGNDVALELDSLF